MRKETSMENLSIQGRNFTVGEDVLIHTFADDGDTVIEDLAEITAIVLIEDTHLSKPWVQFEVFPSTADPGDMPTFLTLKDILN